MADPGTESLSGKPPVMWAAVTVHGKARNRRGELLQSGTMALLRELSGAG